MPVAVYQDTFNAYRTALAASDPLLALRQTVADELRSRGRDRVLTDLEELRELLAEHGENDDVVLDVMDFVTGWCSPHERL